MEYGLDGICKSCQRATAISVNTIQPDGLLCVDCQVNGTTPEVVRTRISGRLRELEEEMSRLRAAMQATMA